MKNTKAILTVLLIGAYAVFIYLYQSRTLASFGVDWRETYYPAVTLLLQGENPYQVPTLYNPVWSLLPLIPFAMAGEGVGEAALFFTAFGVYAWAARRLGGGPAGIIFFMASPLIFYNLMLGNIDWLVVLGFVIPPPIGLFLLVLKPQIGFAPALFWAWQIYRRDGVAGVVRAFAPVGISMLVAVAVFGNWVSGRDDNLLNVEWNMSVFPYLIPVGLFLIYKSRDKINQAVSASPLFSPYLSLGTWSIAQLGVVTNPTLTLAITAGLWVLYFAMGAVFTQ